MRLHCSNFLLICVAHSPGFSADTERTPSPELGRLHSSEPEYLPSSEFEHVLNSELESVSSSEF